MYSSTLDLDNGSVVNKLTQMDGILPLHGNSTDLKDDLVIYACFIKENVRILGNVNSSCTEEVTVSEVNKKKFSNLLNRTIRKNEGLSRQERIFIHQFWYALDSRPKSKQFSHS